MRRITLLGVCILAVSLASGCTGGAAGEPDDDIGDIFVISTSPGNGDELDIEDSMNGFNHLDNPTLLNPGAVTIIFANTLDLSSVLLPPGAADPQGTRNVRLFFFDLDQGPFDPTQPRIPGVNPPGANVLVEADAFPSSTNQENDTLIIRPTMQDGAPISASNPLNEGQYSVVVETGVRGADGDGMKGQEYFFFFRIGPDGLPPVILSSEPSNGDDNVDPTTEVRVTFSETIRAGSITPGSIQVAYQPAGAASPISIPGTWFTDGGNGPGNNLPQRQLDQNGNAGFSGVSPRNGADLVYRPDLDAFPVNMSADDPITFGIPGCNTSDPPFKGNKGFPLGQTVTVQFITTGLGITDTAGLAIQQVPDPNNPGQFTDPRISFETKPLPEGIFAPNANAAIYFGDPVGVGVIDVDPTRTPYVVGPNPPRAANSVVKVGPVGPGQTIVRVPVANLVDLTVEQRPYTAFYSLSCAGSPGGQIFMGNAYAASGSEGGGTVIVIDTFAMTPLGRFGTPSPGGLALTSIGLGGTNTSGGRLVVSNFSANTVTVFDISNVRWITGSPLFATQGGMASGVQAGTHQLILSEEDFERVFPSQRGNSETSPPGPPIIGTIAVGISPTTVKITALPVSMGTPGFPCFSPAFTANTIVAVANSGENTIDLSELVNLNQQAAVQPDLDGLTVSSQPTDITWSPFSFTGAQYFYIAGIGGTVELFASGRVGFTPSVREGSSQQNAPNQIINNIGGFVQPSALQWITNGNSVTAPNGYSHAVLIAETGENRLQQLAVTSEVPSILFEAVSSNLAAPIAPVDITGDPQAMGFTLPCGPRFTVYYAAGTGQVLARSYVGGIVGAEIDVPGVTKIASWWSR